jgi:DNA-binding CsgD family transcriptional regulator
MFDRHDFAYHVPQSAWAIDYLAESARLADRQEDALTILHQLDQLIDGSPAAGVARGTTLARAILAEPDQAERRFDAARHLATTATPWYRARVDLALGAWLRRRRRVAESRRPLAAAQAIFDALGARAWGQRARQELAATGQQPRRREPDGWARLSAQELQIARLAAQGLSNREIGQRLYLSPRTVGSHLYRIFPKLGVSSRAELAGVLSAVASVS